MHPIFHTTALTAALAAGMALSPSARAAANTAPGAAPASTIQLGDFMGRTRSIEVTVGGQRGTFLVDTGGGVTFVTPEFAKKIGCAPWGQISGIRLSGERLDMARCEGVAIGLPNGKTLPSATVGMYDLMSLFPPGSSKVDGSLALDALDGQMFTLDARAGTLEFETAKSLAKATAGAVEIPIRVGRHGASGNGLGIYARSRTAKGDLWLEIDSGSNAPVLLSNKVAGEAGAADPAATKAQPFKLTLSGKGGDVSLDTRAIVRDMIHDGVVGMPVLVHWRLILDLVHDRMWIAPTKG